MNYCDKASSSFESLNLINQDSIESGAKSMIEFIKVEHDEETQFDDERSQEKPFVKYGNDSLEDEDDSLDMITEAEMTKEKFVLMLIESVRKLPILWKFYSRGKRDPSAVQDAWNSLSKQFGMPAEDLKRKWKGLQRQFQCNWVKLRQMRASSGKQNYPTWFAFEAMRFLKDSDDKVIARVEHDEEMQIVDEISLENTFLKGGSYTLDDKNNSADIFMEAAITKEKFILNLINSIRAMPVLWKFNSKGYRDPSAIQDAWNILSGQFAIPAEHLKEKWNSLQSQFRINWKKLRQMRESSDTKYYPTWYAFEAMRFLKESDDKVTEKDETNATNVEDDSSCEQNETTQVEDDSSIEQNEPTQVEEMDKQSVILELIDQVKQTPVLWDQSCPLYNTKAGQMAWNTIAKRMNLPVDDIKLKWKILRTQLRNILHKSKIRSSAGLRVRKPTWFAFEAMQFVLKNKNTYAVGLNLAQKARQPKKVTINPPGSNAVTIKRVVSTTVTPKHPGPSPVAIKQQMPDPLTVTHPLPKPVTIKRILTKPMHFSSMPKPYERDCERRYIGSTVTTPPKVVRITPHSSQSTYNPAALMGYTTSNKMDQCVRNTIRNLSKITDKIAETESSPYSGLLNHLTVVLSKKRANDFNEIEGVLLNCLNELNKFPNVTKDSIIEIPSTNDDYYYPKDEEREDSNDTNDM